MASNLSLDSEVRFSNKLFCTTQANILVHCVVPISIQAAFGIAILETERPLIRA